MSFNQGTYDNSGFALSTLQLHLPVLPKIPIPIRLVDNKSHSQLPSIQPCQSNNNKKGREIKDQGEIAHNTTTTHKE